jgi:hypothetical protein
MTVTQHDLLVNPFKTIFAVNCRVEGTTLHCGALQNIGQEENQMYLFQYAEDVEKLTNSSFSELEQKIMHVTIFMRFRGQAKLPPSNEWVATTDWEEADTEALTKKRLNQIYDLMTWERDGWPKALPEGKVGNAKVAKATPVEA